jgi:hypothetical protein
MPGDISINCIHSYLVHPSKHEQEQPSISGVRIPKRERLFEMLSGIFEKAPSECDIEIIFQPNEHGQQINLARSEIIEYLRNSTIENGRIIAQRLQLVTTKRSGLGLLFLIDGNNGELRRFVISRFPADQGIIAQEGKAQLSVEFVDRIFMKSATSYKSAIYEGISLRGDFWEGKAIDRQINGIREVSNYWITEFLLSDLRTTGPAGTKRLATAIKDAIKRSTHVDQKNEILSFSMLLRGQQGRRISTSGIMQQMGLSPETIQLITDQFSRPELLDDQFPFDIEEYNRNNSYKAIELNNGAILMGQESEFERIFQTEELADGGNKRFITEGRIVDEELRRSK